MRCSLIVIVLAACGFACDERTVTNKHGLTEPTRLCHEGLSAACRNAEDVEALLARDDLEIVAATSTSTGVQRARVLTLRSPSGVVFRAKWRAHTTTTRRNSPRFELAAYAVQKLFLPPREYVVPPTAAHCFPVAAYRSRVDRAARETFAGSGCVYGVLSYWLEDVTSIDDAQRAGWFHGRYGHALDPKLFARDRVYRDSTARVNLLTYVIGHRDSHARNFVIGRTDSKAYLYSIDNSLSFTMAPNPRIQPWNDWSKIRVPALPRAAIDRLRNIDWSGDRLIVGLTPIELEGVRARIAALLERVDRGEVQVF